MHALCVKRPCTHGYAAVSFQALLRSPCAPSSSVRPSVRTSPFSPVSLVGRVVWCLSGLDDPAVCLEHHLDAKEVVERLLGFLLEGDVHTGISYIFKLVIAIVFLTVFCILFVVFFFSLALIVARRRAETARTRRLQRVRLFLRSFVLYMPWIPCVSCLLGSRNSRTGPHFSCRRRRRHETRIPRARNYIAKFRPSFFQSLSLFRAPTGASGSSRSSQAHLPTDTGLVYAPKLPVQV